MAKPHEASVTEMSHETPEERFRELVLIREKENQIEQKLEAAKADTEQKIKHVQAQIDQMRETVERETEQEIASMRQKAIQDAGAEANQLVEQAEQVAGGTESKASGNVQKLINEFKEELLSK